MKVDAYFLEYDDERSGDFRPPRCGFSSSYYGNDIQMSQQTARLRLVVVVAREV